MALGKTWISGKHHPPPQSKTLLSALFHRNSTLENHSFKAKICPREEIFPGFLCPLVNPSTCNVGRRKESSRKTVRPLGWIRDETIPASQMSQSSSPWIRGWCLGGVTFQPSFPALKDEKAGVGSKDVELLLGEQVLGLVPLFWWDFWVNTPCLSRLKANICPKYELWTWIQFQGCMKFLQIPFFLNQHHNDGTSGCSGSAGKLQEGKNTWNLEAPAWFCWVNSDAALIPPPWASLFLNKALN